MRQHTLTLTLAIAALAPLARAQSLIQPDKVLPDDGALGDRFGEALAADDGALLIGAQGDDDNGSNAGSAYLVDIITGLQLAKLLPNDGAPDDHFGQAVAIDAALAAVGAPDDDDGGDASGSVYVFSSLTGELQHKLIADDAQAGDAFGHAVGLSGALVVVGAPGDDDNAQNAGAVYVFDAATGAQLRKILPADGQLEDGFGMSVAINAGVLAVGAPLDNDNGSESGSVYLFDAATGAQLFKLTADDASAQDLFGWSVAVDAGLLVIGAHAKDVSGADSGAVYLFDAGSGLQLDRFTPIDAQPGDWFGWSVDIQDRFVAIGARNDDVWGQSSGSGYVFDVISGNQLYQLLPNDGAEGDFFGAGVAIDSGIVACGAYLDDDLGIASGAAYLFDTNYCSPADIAFPPASIDFSDLLAFLVAFEAMDPLADFDTPIGVFDFADVVAFLTAFAAGCP